MAKLYYGDENNTAVEINVKGDPGPGVADGGTAGQVLAKKSTTDYDTKWIDPPSGSDPDAIKKDGTTVTTARIPFAEGVEVGSSFITDNDIKLNAKNTFAIGLNGVFPHEGQVLTANRDGSCGWADAGGDFTLVSETENARWYKNSVGVKMLVLTKDITVPIASGMGSTTIEAPPAECIPEGGVISLSSGTTIASSSYSIRGVQINSDETTFGAFTTTPHSVALRQQEGTVLLYK